MMDYHDEETANPWYKEFWAWFVFAPLIIVVVACFFMVKLAFELKQDVVSNDYYDVGRAIDQKFDAETTARTLGVTAEMYFDVTANEVVVELNRPLVSRAENPLRLSFSHPVVAKKDYILELTPLTSRRWRAALDSPPTGRWYLRLSAFIESDVHSDTKPEKNNDLDSAEIWRVQGEIDFTHSYTAVISARD